MSRSITVDAGGWVRATVFTWVPSILLVLLPACAGNMLNAPGPEHPASVRAPESPAPGPSATLARAVDPPVVGTDGHGPGEGPSQAPEPSERAAPVQAGTANGRGAHAASYTCPMHPEVVSPQPGRCPKCGMNLVDKEG